MTTAPPGGSRSGLAIIDAPGASLAGEGDLTHSPTALGATLQGALLGTAPYMSPEQARGLTVDKRTDIWAFGCVLYEMLTGRRAFAGETVSEILAEVLKGERLTGAPEIAIEILSPGSSNELRDRQIKRKLYSTRGVDEYWIVDPENRSIEIHRKKKQGGLKLAAQLRAGDELTTTLLPGFAMPVEAVFEE